MAAHACVTCGARAAWRYTGEDQAEDWLCSPCAEHWLATLVLESGGDHDITLRVIGDRLLLVSDEAVTEGDE
jgi:hypothetical protein